MADLEPWRRSSSRTVAAHSNPSPVFQQPSLVLNSPPTAHQQPSDSPAAKLRQFIHQQPSNIPSVKLQTSSGNHPRAPQKPRPLSTLLQETLTSCGIPPATLEGSSTWPPAAIKPSFNRDITSTQQPVAGPPLQRLVDHLGVTVGGEEAGRNGSQPSREVREPGPSCCLLPPPSSLPVLGS